MSRSTMLRRVLLIVPLSALLVGLQLHSSGVALAQPSGGNCGYGGSWTLSQYRSAGCAYDSTPYTQNANDFLYVHVYKANSFPSRIESDIQTAIYRWNYSSAYVRLQIVGSPSSSNPLTISSSIHGFNDDDCTGTWGYGWDGGNGDFQQVVLNQYDLNRGCGSDNGWAGLIAHEMGHDMGLAHNVHRYDGDSNCNGATYSMLMLGGCAIKSLTPQVSDYDIFNAIYPNYLSACASSPSEFHCNGMLHDQQGCGDTILQTVSDTNVSVKIHWGGSCETNWTSAKILTSGYTIYKETLERVAGPTVGAWTMADLPDDTTTSWVTSMLFSPDNNTTRGCVWYKNLSTGAISNAVCTKSF